VRRLFAVYAAASLVPVVLLGLVLMWVLNDRASSDGLAQGRDKADLIARVSVAPQLSDADLRAGLTDAERTALKRTVGQAIADQQVLRLRLRDLAGTIVYADDGTTGGADDESLEAARGRTVSKLTYLNADDEDSAPSAPDASDEPSRGPRVVEVYEPLAVDAHRVGVLEMYVPYAPIAAAQAAGQRVVAITLSAGLLVLWLCLLLVSASVTGRLRRQSSLNAYLATHDSLTGLANRPQFSQRAAAAAALAGPEAKAAIALVDLDRFKEINDTLGHTNGDQLLIELAGRLRASVGPQDSVARLGGDEFGLVLTGVRDAEEAIERLTRLRAVVAAPVSVDGLPLAVEASVGFALVPDDGVEVDQLLQRADLAMYAAKRQHCGVIAYELGQDTYDASTLTLVAELGAAIADDQLVLHYQTKGDVRRGRVTAVEALVRWQHPTRGLLPPDSFLPAAEQTELIEELTRWVLRTAASELPMLDPEQRLAVAVNISARSLIRDDFADDVLAVLAETDVDPTRVILELTETALLADPARAAATLTRLHDAGVRVSIDDFGAGQTSLGYLASLPISELKIDKAFVLSMLADARNAAIVHSVIELGHGLGASVTAEGVESVEALVELSRYGCDTVQGYLLSRPVTSLELRARLGAVSAVLLDNSGRITTPRPGRHAADRVRNPGRIVRHPAPGMPTSVES